MAPTIEPIETEYAGHRFRSRLEARWAVFFTALRIKWQYEVQGYLLGDQKRPYLPDFWLPDLGVWVEVKGEMAALDVDLMDLAVSRPGGLPGSDCWGELCMLILGPIPEPGLTALHWMLSRPVYAPCSSAKDFCACHDLRFTQEAFVSMPDASAIPARLRVNVPDTTENPGAVLFQVGRSLLKPIWDDIVTSRPFGHLRADPRIDIAYRAARSARFEHGESPEPAA